MPTITQLTRAQTVPDSGAEVGARSSRVERGYTLVEMIVVCLIIGIILATVISTFRGAKKATFAKAGQATAFAYQDAVEAYMSDYGQRAPIMGDPTAWPVEDKGPVDREFSNKTYLRTVPEHVQGGLVDLIKEGETPKLGAQTVIEYKIDPTNPGLYTFDVWVVQGADWNSKNLDCIVTNRGVLNPGEKRCVS